MTEESKTISQTNSTDVQRMAKVLGNEYGLTPSQIARLEVEQLEDQELLAREFRAENANTAKPGEMGKRIAKRAFGNRSKSKYFKD